jgi:hypothetical protein
MTLSEMASAVRMLPMALMAYLQHLFSGAATRRNTSNYSAVIVKLSAQGCGY